MLKKLKDLDLRKFSNALLRWSASRTQAIRDRITVSVVILYNLLIRSIQSTRYYFFKWYAKSFVQPRGLVFVGGLEYSNLINETWIKIVNKNPKSRLYNMGAFLQAIDTPPQVRMFVPGITEEEMEEFKKILTLYLTKGGEISIPDVFDLIRAFLGPVYLIKKFFKKDLFTVFVGVLTPEEALWLRKKRYYLIYLQSKEMKSRWERGFSYCSISYDLTLFEPPTEVTIMNIFSKCGLRTY